MSTTDEKTPVVNQDEQAPVPQVNGEPIEAVAAEQQQDGEQPAIEEQVIDLKPVTIRLPTPNYPQTLPKSGDNKTNTPSTFIMHPQPTETIQDIRATLLEWIGGYWLGPYSLRIPRSGGGKTTSEEKGRLLGTGKEGVEIREGEKLSDWIEIGEVFSHLEGQDNAERVLVVQREPYSEADARQAVLRLRDYTMPSSEVTPTFATIGLNPGSSIFEGIQTGSLVDSSITDDSKPASVNKPVVKNGKQANKPTKVKPETETDDALFADWKGLPKTDVAKLPLAMPPLPHPSCLRSLIFSPFNPPPPHLKQKGHLIYLTAVTLEGEAVMIVCSTKGWYVARSTAPSVSFDPAPRTTPKEIKSHSLVDLLHALSPLFTSTLRSLQTQASNPALAREPIASVPIPQYPPAYPWIASAPNNSAVNPDLVKTQLAYGYTGAITPDALEGARDWNEELQNAREMPKSTTQERVLRERVMQKTHAEFTAACIRGSMAIARGDLQPINPHEDEKAHMWLANNIFYTKGVNSVDAYTHLGGDEAARISHAKDAAGVKLLNRLDVDNVYLLGHTVVDWQGERWVCQSVLPGIFSRRREDAEDEQAEAPKVDGEGATEAEATTGEKDSAAEPAPDAVKDANEVDNYLVIYGADSEGGIDKLHWDAGMHKIMGKVAASQRLALHKMKDSNGDEYDFWTSVDVKGLRGSDGRRYLLDLPRLSPVDIEFLQKDVEGKLMAGAEETDAKDGVAYPHRVVLLRPELLDSYWDHELKLWARQIQAKKAEEQKEKTDDKAEGAAEQGASESKPAQDDAAAAASTIPADTPRFDLRFNADAFVDQPVKADAETGEVKYQASTQTDESEPSIKAVRDASIFLRTVVVPSLILDVIASNTLGIMDGLSLSKHLHAKGINMRYLGHVMSHIEKYIKTSEGEGVGHLKAISSIVQQEMVFRACKHILRRLVHGQSAENSAAAVSHFLNCLLGSDKNANPVAEYEALDFQDASAPAYTQLTPESLRSEIVAEIATRFRWTLDETYFDQDMRKPQLLKELASRIAFQLDQRAYQFVGTDEESAVEDQDATTKSKKAKKASKTATTVRKTTFEPCDILTLLPVVKSTAPSAAIAEEIFETGRATVARGDVGLGLEFMLEGINMFEQTHQVVHPEVCSAYNQYAVTIHQLVRIRIQQLASEEKEGDPTAGLDVATAIKLQQQAVMAAERTLGLHHHDTIGYYFNLAMLENMQGNHTVTLRLFKHILHLWDVVYGRDHPELPSILIHVAVVLQAQNRHAASIVILNEVYRISCDMFGSTHLLAGTAMSQLTQAHFLNGDIKKAAECAKEASDVFRTRLGPEDLQAKEAATNYEILSGAIEQSEKQQEAAKKQLEQIRAIQQSRQAATPAAASGNKRAAVAAAQEAAAAIAAGGAKGPDGQPIPASEVDVDALVRYIQGQTKEGVSTNNKGRGKNALRGKKRTGGKR